MKYDVTEFLFNRNIFTFNIIEITDKIYVDFGNEIDFRYADNIKLIYDSEINKIFIDPDNVVINEKISKIFCINYRNIENKIIEINNDIRKQNEF